ncbi:hypothetical protein E6O75_ATG06535 [Venturia nashicola]|uniref:Uncharacterized protein n=1 Tax=Venturia nashicola TaxID=86259 RepID=A0A4Z1NU87_9PEZI|nr:hypothetical protein E6O75_ATG06535 [Venturia nashicola]
MTDRLPDRRLNNLMPNLLSLPLRLRTDLPPSRFNLPMKHRLTPSKPMDRNMMTHMRRRRRYRMMPMLGPDSVEL